MSDELKVVRKNKSNKIFLISIVIIIVVVVLVTTLAVFIPKSAKAKKLEEQLSLGEKYLSELNYEQAIASYLTVIEIDPKNADAYLGLADAYVAQGEYEKAMEVLEEALTVLSGDVTTEVRNKRNKVYELLNSVGLTFAPVSVINDIEWEENEDGTITITNIKNDAIVHMEIPQIIEEKPVTCITEDAWKNCKNLLTVSIPATLEYIGYDCLFFHNLDVTDNIKAYDVDDGNPVYASVDGVLYSKDMTILYDIPNAYEGSLLLPETVISAAIGAFENCSKLSELKFPSVFTGFDSLSIDEEFVGCSSLENIYVDEKNPIYVSLDGVLCELLGTEYRLVKVPAKYGETIYEVPKMVRWVECYAFDGCSIIETIKLHDKVHLDEESPYVLGGRDSNLDYSFENYINLENCPNLKYILAEGAPEITSVDGVLYSKDKTILLQMPRGYEQTHFVVPEGVEVISLDAFSNCIKLESIILPESLNLISNGAFRGCTSLKEIVIPKGVNYVGRGAFSGCSNLLDVHISNPTIYLEDYVFSKCNEYLKVTEITGPNVEPYEGMFQWYWNKDGESVAITGVVYRYKEEAEYIIPAEIEGKPVTRIDRCPFLSSNNLSRLVIPDSLKEIDDEAFWGHDEREITVVCSKNHPLIERMKELGFTKFEYKD